MDWSISTLAAVALHSRIVIEKLDDDQLNIFWMIEKSQKLLIKRKTDVK